MIVIKFGGSSVGTAESIKVVGDVLRNILKPQSIFIHPSTFLEGVRNPNEVIYDSFSDENIYRSSQKILLLNIQMGNNKVL